MADPYGELSEKVDSLDQDFLSYTEEFKKNTLEILIEIQSLGHVNSPKDIISHGPRLEAIAAKIERQNQVGRCLKGLAARIEVIREED